jgi:hypothetical protein
VAVKELSEWFAEQLTAAFVLLLFSSPFWLSPILFVVCDGGR